MSNSSTAIFYALLDMEEGEQQRLLSALEAEQPALHEEVSALWHADENAELGLTTLVEGGAVKVFEQVCFSGQTLGKYLIRDKIGQGGMGMVYAAMRQDDTYEQELAIKFIQPALTSLLGQKALYQEAQLLALLDHPYIAKVFDAGNYQSHVYMVMEKIKGQDLQDYVKTNSASLKTIVKFFMKVCDAIAHAHQHQVLHADIKPENILVDERGNPKVFDFNITQKSHLSGGGNSSLKAFSKDFVSPEQQLGKALTQQSDVFSLGKLLAFCLEGATTNKELAAIIAKATEPSLSERYVSVSHLRNDLLDFVKDKPVSVMEQSLWYLTTKLVTRRPLASLLSATLVISLCSFSLVLFKQNQRLKAEQALTEDMVLELTNIVFHGKSASSTMEMESMLALTRRKILANQFIPSELKQRLIVAMMVDVPKKDLVVTHE